VAPNRLQPEFLVLQPETVAVGDLPDLPPGEGGRSLAVVWDLGSRAVVGWAMANHRRADLVTQAVAMASCQRQPAAGLMMPTDRGSQYGADSSRQLLAQQGIQPRMSRQGHGWDNAVAASFFHTWKTALGYLEDFDTHEPAQMGVFA
jgi:putative transposase